MKASNLNQPRKLVFGNGKAEVIKPTFEGEIEFYKLDRDKIEAIMKEINVQKSKKSQYGDLEMMYKIIPYMCSVEMDVTLEEFIDMVTFPTKEVSEFITALMDQFIDIIENTKNSFNEYAKLDVAIQKNPALAEQIKSKQEIQKELYQELFKNKNNPAKRKEIFNQLAKI